MPGEPSTARWVELGVLGRAHGLKGEINLRTTPDQNEILTNTEVIRVEGKKVSGEYRILSVRDTNTGVLLLLEGVDDRDKASALTGNTISVRREAFPELEPGEFYYSDLEGAPVKDKDGNTLGKVLYFEEYGTDLMFFDWTGHGTVALPMVKDFIIEVIKEPASVVIETEQLDELLQD